MEIHLIILKLKTVDYHEINAAYFAIPEKHKTSPTQIKWEYICLRNRGAFKSTLLGLSNKEEPN